MKYLRRSDLAKVVGVHPNTVRRYVDRGLLPPVEHSPSGYRRFTQRHLDCLHLARQVYCNQYPGKAIHQSGIRIAYQGYKINMEMAHTPSPIYLPFPFTSPECEALDRQAMWIGAEEVR